MATGAALQLGAVAPEDAIAVFQQRGLLRTSFRWQEVWQAEHTRAFTVAGVLRLDVLETFQREIGRAIAEGGNFADFHRTMKAALVSAGYWGNVEITDPATGEVRTTRFNDARLRLIFDTNLRISHAAGRWQRVQRGRLPLLVYRTMGDERVRLTHRQWDYIVLPKDHPWWDKHYPPNDWRCRCWAYGIDEAGVQALIRAGRRVLREPPPEEWVPWLNRLTGVSELVPKGVGPAFAYNPGQVATQRGAEFLARRLADMPQAAAANDPLNPVRRPTAADRERVVRAAVARGRREPAFAEFLTRPPVPGPGVGEDVALPVAVVPTPGAAERGTVEPGRSMAGSAEPAWRLASVSASGLLGQAPSDVPKLLPTVVADWALAQAVIDQGERLELAGGALLYWWQRGSGTQRRVHVVELAPAADATLGYLVQQLATLSPEEAASQYPALAMRLAVQGGGAS